jgi:hypothetical protein
MKKGDQQRPQMRHFLCINAKSEMHQRKIETVDGGKQDIYQAFLRDEQKDAGHHRVVRGFLIRPERGAGSQLEQSEQFE